MMRYCKLLLIPMILFTLTGCCGCSCGSVLPVIAGGLLMLSWLLLPTQKLAEDIMSYSPDFYNYEGFRDFYRFPLIYPYHITMIDTCDRGQLEEYIGGDIRDSNVSSKSVFEGCISAIIQRDDSLIFKLEKPDREGNFYGIFDYRIGEVRRFKDTDSLRGALEPGFPLNFEPLKKAYDDYWYPAKKLRRNDEMANTDEKTADSDHYRKSLLLKSIKDIVRDFITFLIVSAWIVLVTMIANLANLSGMFWIVLLGMFLIGIIDLWIRKPGYTERFWCFAVRISIAELAALLLFNMLLEQYILSDWIDQIRNCFYGNQL